MAYYTNEASLKATFGDKEAAGLIQDAPGVDSDVRLEKAAKEAYDEINMYLGSSGYVVPLEFTAFGDTEEEEPIPLNGKIQGISDCFTAYILAGSTDLNKKRYELCRAENVKFLENVLAGLIRLDLEAAVVSGTGSIAVRSRPRVFDTNLKTQGEIFTQFFPD